jgi:hypothetical protein
MSVLHKVQDNLAESGGYEIRGIAKKYITAGSRADLRIREFLGFTIGDWLIREAPATLRRLNVEMISCVLMSRMAHHFVHDVDRFAEAIRLETYALIRSE